MQISINASNIGNSPSITWNVVWGGSGSTIYISGTKNNDGSMGTSSSAGWTCYVGFEGGSSASVFFYSKNIAGSYSDVVSYMTSVSISNPPESGTMYFYTTSTSFTSSGVISYADRKKETFYKVTVEDRVTNSSGKLLGWGWQTVPEGITVHGRTLREASYDGYTYSSDSYSYINSDKTLYCYFNPNVYSIYYYQNDSNGTVTNMPSSGSISYGSSISYTTPSNNYRVTFNGNGGTPSTPYLDSPRAFLKWNTESDGSGVDWSPGDTFNQTTNLYLYAQWGTVSSITLPSATRTSYRLLGWNTSSTATTGITGSYTPPSNIILYAIWTPAGIIRLYNSSNSFQSYSLLIYTGDGGGPNSDGWHHAVLMIYCTINGVTKFHTAG